MEAQSLERLKAKIEEARTPTELVIAVDRFLIHFSRMQRKTFKKQKALLEKLHQKIPVKATEINDKNFDDAKNKILKFIEEKLVF